MTDGQSILVGICSACITTGLGINAYFIKGLIEQINGARLDIASGKAETKGEINLINKRLDNAESNDKYIFKRLYNLEQGKK